MVREAPVGTLSEPGQGLDRGRLGLALAPAGAQGKGPEAPGEGGVLTAATAASSRHAAPHPLVGRPPLRSGRRRCARAAEGLR